MAVLPTYPSASNHLPPLLRIWPLVISIWGRRLDEMFFASRFMVPLLCPHCGQAQVLFSALRIFLCGLKWR